GDRSLGRRGARPGFVVLELLGRGRGLLRQGGVGRHRERRRRQHESQKERDQPTKAGEGGPAPKKTKGSPHGATTFKDECLVPVSRTIADGPILGKNKRRAPSIQTTKIIKKI